MVLEKDIVVIPRLLPALGSRVACWWQDYISVLGRLTFEINKRGKGRGNKRKKSALTKNYFSIKCPRPKKNIKQKTKISNILDNLTEFTKCLVYSRFQFELEQFVNIYVKCKGGTGIDHTLSLIIQEWLSIIPKPLVLLSLTSLQVCQRYLLFQRNASVCSQPWLLNSWNLW